jgi:hypothetical protein
VTHEDAVFEKHPTAREFRAVRWLGSSLIGWTFEIPDESEGGVRYGWVTQKWVTRDAEEVSSDRLGERKSALINLDQYVKATTNSSSSYEPVQIGD